MKRASPPVLLACALLFLVASAQAGTDSPLAEAKQALIERDLSGLDVRTGARYVFRISPGSTWRLHRSATSFAYDGPAQDLSTEAVVRLRFAFTPPGAVTALRGPNYSRFKPRTPLRAAFYYPWYPHNWGDGTLFHPTLGLYDSNDAAAIRAHLAAMRYGNFDVGIYSWWGRGDRTDLIFLRHLALARATAFRWAVYYEPEGYGNPSFERLRRDLAYILDRYSRDPAYLRLRGRPVLFAWGDAADSCETTARWREANRGRFYVVLKVFPGFQYCLRQPDGWHQYGPAVAEDEQAPWAYTISPGFHRAGGEPARLERDLSRWRSSVEDMVVSGVRFQLVTSYNEWNEGTAVESADEWASPSGFGAYLDVLHELPTR